MINEEEEGEEEEKEEKKNKEFRDEEKILSLHEALQQIHNPDDTRTLKTAVYRLKYDEHFFLQLLMALKRQAKEENTDVCFHNGVNMKKIFLRVLNLHLQMLRYMY